MNRKSCSKRVPAHHKNIMLRVYKNAVRVSEGEHRLVTTRIISRQSRKEMCTIALMIIGNIRRSLPTRTTKRPTDRMEVLIKNTIHRLVYHIVSSNSTQYSQTNHVQM